MPTQMHSFNILIRPEQLEILKTMAAEKNVSAASLVRDLIARLHSMHVSNVPVCVTGQMCFVPHLHQAAPKPQFLPTPNNLEENKPV